MEKIEWTAGTGQAIVVTVELVTEREINADGDKMTVPCCELRVWAEGNGRVLGSGEPCKCEHAVAVARIGHLGLTQANYDRVLAAINRAKASPEWQAKIARQRAAYKLDEEYERHAAAVDRMMTLDGHTY